MRVMQEKEIEAVMHFAAYALVGESVQHPAMYYQNNVTATFELLEAMQTVPAELWVVGNRLPSDRGEDLAPHFARFAETGRLRSLGYRTDVADILAAADIFVLPSHFEGLPMSVIEAMLTGLPVVATDIHGPREQIIPEKTGVLVPVRNAPALATALTRLAENPALRARMGTAALARARDLYDETRIVAHTLDLMGL